MTGLHHWQLMTRQPRPRPLSAFGLQRRCACGGVVAAGGECAACRARRLGLQRQAEHETAPSQAPRAVGEVIRSPGQVLDPATRSFMESRLGHDFRHVRVHRDARAGETARAVGALAYTVGRHIVFGPGQYAPGSSAGRRLLAHELAHVAQQSRGDGHAAVPSTIPVLPAGTVHERQAEALAGTVAGGPRSLGPARGLTADLPAGLARQPAPNPEYWLNLRFEESGRVQLTVSGPGLPVVGNPTLGLRRNPSGDYQMVFGNKDKVVTPGEIPDLVRGTLGTSGRPGAPAPPTGFRTPACAALRAPSGGRFMTYDEYRISQMLSPTLLPMSPPLYEARIAGCTESMAEPPAEAATPAPAPAPAPALTGPATAPAGGETPAP